MRTQYSPGYSKVNSQSVLTGHNLRYSIRGMKTLAERAKLRMKELDLNQVELADLAGISQNSVHKILAGKTLETKKLPVIARALKCSAEWLATGQGPMTASEQVVTLPEADTRGGMPLLTTDELKLLKYFRKSEIKYQKTILDVARAGPEMSGKKDDADPVSE